MTPEELEAHERQIVYEAAIQTLARRICEAMCGSFSLFDNLITPTLVTLEQCDFLNAAEAAIKFGQEYLEKNPDE